MRVASCELRVASCELRVASCELRVASCELRVASCELRVASCDRKWCRFLISILKIVDNALGKSIISFFVLLLRRIFSQFLSEIFLTFQVPPFLSPPFFFNYMFALLAV